MSGHYLSSLDNTLPVEDMAIIVGEWLIDIRQCSKTCCNCYSTTCAVELNLATFGKGIKCHFDILGQLVLMYLQAKYTFTCVFTATYRLCLATYPLYV